MFAAYSAVMLYLLFFERMTGDGLSFLNAPDYAASLSHKFQLIPFKTIGDFIGQFSTFSVNDPAFGPALVNIAGNIAVFVPLGVFLPLLFPKLLKFLPFLLTFSIIIVCVEITQALTLLGSCDIDDLILNTAGGSIGYLIASAIHSKHFLRLRGSVRQSDER